MKPHFNFLSTAFFPKRLLIYPVIVMIGISQSSCFRHFYQSNTTHVVNADTLERLQAGKKYFIVHSPGSVFELKDVQVKDGFLTAKRDSLDPRYDQYLNPIEDKPNPFPGREKHTCFSMVHLYTNTSFEGSELISLSTDQISRMDVYGPDNEATAHSRAMSIGGITLGLITTFIGMGFISSNNLNAF